MSAITQVTTSTHTDTGPELAKGIQERTEIAFAVLQCVAARALQLTEELDLLCGTGDSLDVYVKKLGVEQEPFQRILRVLFKLGIVEPAESGFTYTQATESFLRDAHGVGPTWERAGAINQYVKEGEVAAIDTVLSPMLKEHAFPLLYGHLESRLLYAAVANDVPEKLQAKAPLSAGEEALLPYLEKRGYLQDGTLTSKGICLLKESPTSLAYMILNQSPARWRVFQRLDLSLQGRTDAFEHVLGQPLFDFLKAHPEQHQIFDRAMEQISRIEVDVLRAFAPLKTASTLIDIGGGKGTVLAALSEGKTGILFDLPEVVKKAAPEVLETNCTIVGGSFFEKAEIPKSDGIYYLKRVLHDWDDEKTKQILGNIAQAMLPGARLWIIEPMLTDAKELGIADVADLYLLPLSNGKERSVDQYCELIKGTGLQALRVEMLGGYLVGLELALA